MVEARIDDQDIVIVYCQNYAEFKKLWCCLMKRIEIL